MGKTTLRFLPVCMGIRKTIGLGRTILPVCMPGIRKTIGLGKNILPVCVGIRKTVGLVRTTL